MKIPLLLRCRATLVLLIGLALAPLSWCGEPQPLKIVATFSILADMTREVAGNAAVVSSLIGPNADAHAFEPTAASIKQVASADLLIVNGLGFEHWLNRLLRISGFKGTLVVATQGIEPRRLGGTPDPHAWLSLVKAQVYVNNLQKALTLAAPSHAAAIQARAAQYLQKINELDARTKDRLQAIPPDLRRLITSHDAFGYLADALGLTILSPQGWKTNSEPSAGQVAKVIRQIRAQKAQAVFIENISDPRLIQQIAAESGARVGGMLYSDALSPPGGPADSYLKLMEHNLQAIETALMPQKVPAR